ncbi:hypothetical protein ACWDTT_10845 [Streptosporangium sandarakinum]|uniref:hypothetical protein n=1 Tax=Streptosporangium TaxID=2000 RepID=UPI0031F95511
MPDDLAEAVQVALSNGSTSARSPMAGSRHAQSVDPSGRVTQWLHRSLSVSTAR